MIGLPFLISRKESCFSAVVPVSGRNQCVKWVAPRSSAQCFIAWATSAAIAGSSGAPLLMVASSFSAVAFGRYSRITSALNTSSP